MDIVTGSTTGRDALRDFLRAGATIPDDELQGAWDGAVDATYRWIREGYDVDAPQGVIDFVIGVASHKWRVRDTGGETQFQPDGSFSTGSAITSSLVRRYAVLGGPYVQTPRVVAGLT